MCKHEPLLHCSLYPHNLIDSHDTWVTDIGVEAFTGIHQRRSQNTPRSHLRLLVLSGQVMDRWSVYPHTPYGLSWDLDKKILWNRHTCDIMTSIKKGEEEEEEEEEKQQQQQQQHSFGITCGH